MYRLRYCLLLVAVCSFSQYGNAEKFETETIIVPHENSPTTVIPITETPETTSLAPNTTTPEPTTTPAPTTTAKPTTTPAPTTTKPTTTAKPTTTPAPTTTAKPTTTPAPTPKPIPSPTQGTWIYTNKTANITCIVVQFAAQLNITYPKLENNATVLSHVIINVPANATVVNGSCTGADQWLSLSWPSTQDSETNNLTLVYHRNETTKNYGLKNLTIELTADNFGNASSIGAVDLYHGAEWQTPLATSYRCKMATQLNMTSDSTSVAAVLTMSQLQEEAYRTKSDKQFSAARECGGADVPDAVPIAVGCALGGLVLVVLVAYLVGRRRSAARGYLSM